MKKVLGFVRKKKRKENLDLEIPDGVSSDINGKHASEVYRDLVLEQKPNWTHLGEFFHQQGTSQQNHEPEKNKFVINVNNARFFHIGTRKSINIGNALTMEKCETPPHCDSSFYVKTHSDFLDEEESLKEAYISLIALHVNDRWKDFLKNLGLEEHYLEVLELRSSSNKILAVYDGLQKYKTLFPNTSIGFVIHVLIQAEQVATVNKLMSEMKLS